MKRDWLLYLMIFSLALNVGAIGTFAYLYWQGPGPSSPARGGPRAFSPIDERNP